jgi:hypothetical protein
VKGNDKPAILEALVSSNNKVWGDFNMHPLKTNMRLATVAAAQACGGLLSQEEEEQLRYAEILIDVSNNCNTPWCHVIEQEDENVSKLGLPFVAILHSGSSHECSGMVVSRGALRFLCDNFVL